MAELKTKETDADVGAFLDTVTPAKRREDAGVLLRLFNNATDLRPRIWGDSIIGYGAYDYTYKSGRSGRWMLTGFSPRKTALTVYIMPGFGSYGALLDRIGHLRHSVSCLYIPRLDRIDQSALVELITTSVSDMRRIYNVPK